MKTMIVDDNDICLSLLKTLCEQLNEIELCGSFLDPMDALGFARENEIELAILDIEMPEMSGIELGKQLRSIREDILLVYLSSHEERYGEAVRIRADKILIKPVNMEDLSDMLYQMRLLSKRFKKPIRVQMLGRFQVFVKEKPLRLPNKKAKELLALCLDRRGARVSMDEVCAVLWEDKVYDRNTKQLYRKAVRATRKFFVEAGLQKFFLTDRGYCYIDTAFVDCDYYHFLEDPHQYSCPDMYLFDYDWGEERLAEIEAKYYGKL